MKFAFFGYDFMADMLERLIQDGHELTALFTFPCDERFNSNFRIIQCAEQQGVSVKIEKPTPEDIESAIKNDTQCFLAAGYLYKIPPIDETRAYGVNIHPALLPKGRGIMPMPHILLHSPQASGITAHKLTQDYDSGDILKQLPLPVSPNEDVETLTARLIMCAPDFASDLLQNLPEYWRNASPQNEADATHWDAPSEEMRNLDWTKTVSEIAKTARAFGRYGSLAHFNNETWVVYDSAGWQEAHNFTPGTIACLMSRHIIMAVKDGFVCLKDLEKLS